MATFVRRRGRSARARLAHSLLVIVGAAALTGLVFLILPLLQAITSGPKADLEFRSVDSVVEPPPPVVEEETEPEEEEEEPEPEPQLADSQQPDLQAIQDALGRGAGAGGAGSLGIDFDLGKAIAGAAGDNGILGLAASSQKPRQTYAPPLRHTPRTKRASPGFAEVGFIVDERGRVVNPQILSSSDRVFEGPALDFISKHRFSPGTRNGKPDDYRMKRRVTF